MRRSTIAVGVVTVVLIGTTVWTFLKPTPGPTGAKSVAALQPSTTVSVGTDSKATATATATPEPIAPAIPLNADRSKQSAVVAAVRFLELDEQLFPAASPATARALSDQITSKRSNQRLGDLSEKHQEATLAKGDLEGLLLRIAPIETRVRNHNKTSSTVDVFFLRLWSFPTRGALDDYATAQIDLVWEQNMWRLDDSSVIDGPYPAGRFSARPNLASVASTFESVLTGFDDESMHQ
jgi:hypothetical protein